MAITKTPMITAEDSAELPEEFNKWIWLKVSTGELHKFVGGSWTVFATLVMANFTGNIDISGTVEANKGEFAELEVGGKNGIDSEVTISGTTLKFKGGVLYEVE